MLRFSGWGRRRVVQSHPTKKINFDPDRARLVSQSKGMGKKQKAFQNSLAVFYIL
jgi:hypothetical protein